MTKSDYKNNISMKNKNFAKIIQDNNNINSDVDFGCSIGSFLDFTGLSVSDLSLTVL